MSKFVNPAFREIFAGITQYMPQITFFGIIAVYLITAVLNMFFIPLPIWLSAPAALAIQFGRFSIVFMDFLNPTGRRSPWPALIATVFTALALAELGFSIQDLGWVEAKWWSTFIFGTMLICMGYLLEINFIAKGAEAFGMKSKGELASKTQQASIPLAMQTQAGHQEEILDEIPFEFNGASLNGNGRH